jgi:uncharacterized paraquat-inducible protein A
MFTRWKINSIGYAHRILAVIGVLVVVIPLACYLCAWLGIENAVLFLAIKVYFTVGIALLALFALFLAVEFIQDSLLNAYYARTRSQKLKLTNGWYECQHCGSRKVHEDDKQCPVCGKVLQ